MIKFTFKIFLLLVSIFTPIFAMAENEDNNEVGDLKYEITGEILFLYEDLLITNLFQI